MINQCIYLFGFYLFIFIYLFIGVGMLDSLRHFFDRVIYGNYRSASRHLVEQLGFTIGFPGPRNFDWPMKSNSWLISWLCRLPIIHPANYFPILYWPSTLLCSVLSMFFPMHFCGIWNFGSFSFMMAHVKLIASVTNFDWSISIKIVQLLEILYTLHIHWTYIRHKSCNYYNTFLTST